MNHSHEQQIEIEAVAESDKLHLNLEGFDGPIDLLLDLAKKQKVDLIQISVVALAEQYLNYIDRARALELDVAADYLVMAAWLTYLKSRLIVPDEEEEADPDSEYMAHLLMFQLKRLEAMREAGEALFKRPVLNYDTMARGRGKGPRIKRQLEFDLKWHDLLHCYAQIWARKQKSEYKPQPRRRFYKIEDALSRLATMLGLARDWVSMQMFLPITELKDYIMRKSAVASTFGAFLELTKQGRLDIKQDELFGPIFARKIMEEEEDDDE